MLTSLINIHYADTSTRRLLVPSDGDVHVFRRFTMVILTCRYKTLSFECDCWLVFECGGEITLENTATFASLVFPPLNPSSTLVQRIRSP